MARKSYGTSEVKFQKWIKDGRGSGRGIEYKPWITVRDLPSEGRSHRIFGHKSQRTHHLLSDLELAVFLLLEWHSEVIEIREQFPLERDITSRLAIDIGISHPAISGFKQYMSSDFLVNAKDLKRPKFVLQAKYADALNDPRTIEKLEIERRYWVEKNIPWQIVTEKEIPSVVVKNINWLYPAKRDEINHETVLERVQFYAHHFQKSPDILMIDICKSLDIAYDQPPGESLQEIRQLLARRCFLFDLFTPTIKLKAKQLKSSSINHLVETLHVSNQ
ncbi:TnsA endonuclease N-terminal domain-containing protein [Methylicorpusculum oleiharenae]|uniref:TnsA endonuclease C-terminal domain-containing protein n=1 Tax=Methylicorpusculum oleiharenae TaxID=1338687 RepID=UPI001357D96B|nr:TnsA endonuclease C-terminal domain-containing protein [Methylicorpusculum oleiharenae]MCD2449837.1 TnsA endonuclease N-terminal domain-containing protein [Methylicorpusculum oleiharenae]